MSSKSSSDGQAQGIYLYETLTPSPAILFSQEVDERFAKGVVDLIGRLPESNSDDYAYLKKLHRWWSKALWDEDPVDRFVDYYVCCEIIGGRNFSNFCPAQRVREILSKSTGLGGGIDKAKHIIKLRGALFHSGEKEAEVQEYNPMLEATIRDEFAKLIT